MNQQAKKGSDSNKASQKQRLSSSKAARKGVSNTDGSPLFQGLHHAESQPSESSLDAVRSARTSANPSMIIASSFGGPGTQGDRKRGPANEMDFSRSQKERRVDDFVAGAFEGGVEQQPFVGNMDAFTAGQSYPSSALPQSLLVQSQQGGGPLGSTNNNILLSLLSQFPSAQNPPTSSMPPAAGAHQGQSSAILELLQSRQQQQQQHQQQQQIPPFSVSNTGVSNPAFAQFLGGSSQPPSRMAQDSSVPASSGTPDWLRAFMQQGSSAPGVGAPSVLPPLQGLSANQTTARVTEGGQGQTNPQQQPQFQDWFLLQANSGNNNILGQGAPAAFHPNQSRVDSLDNVRPNDATSLGPVPASSTAGVAQRKSAARQATVLYSEHDEKFLSPYQCLVRRQIEMFETNEDDVRFMKSKTNKSIVLGQVGIRCKHCASLPQYSRPKASVYYPPTLDSLYQYGQNMVKHHFTGACKSIPEDMKKTLMELQNEKRRGKGGRERWAKAARDAGVIEFEHGLVFDVGS